MDVRTRNLLYRQPELYEEVYHAKHDLIVRACDRIFAEYLPGYPRTLLDAGSGTGCEVAHFAGNGADCVGVDVQQGMVEYARSRSPEVEFIVADVRAFRLGRSFDAIVSLGYVLANLHDAGDLDAAVASFAAHSKPGTLLVLEVINPYSWLSGGMPGEFAIDTHRLSARAEATFQLDRRRQLVTRTRSWSVEGAGVVDDFVVFRLFFPRELERHLSDHGFEVMEIYDNLDLLPGDLSGDTMLVVASFRGSTARGIQ